MKTIKSTADFLSLADTFPKKYFIMDNRVRPCVLVDIPGRGRVHVTKRHDALLPVSTTVYETQEEARKALEEKRALLKKKQDEAIATVARMLEHNWAGNKARYARDATFRDMCDRAGDVAEKSFFDELREANEALLSYIAHGAVNMNGVTFRPEQVAFLRFGHPTVSYRQETTPIEVTLKDGRTVVTRSKFDSTLLQAIFGPNRTQLGWEDVKWKNEIKD